MKILFISLGCDKNLVDTEVMLGLLASRGYEMTDDETQADVIVINTCCFIHDAKEESIQNILEMAEYKKRGTVKALIVTGCLAQRYRQEIIDEIPEVDEVLGTTAYDKILDAVDAALRGEHEVMLSELDALPLPDTRRLVTTGAELTSEGETASGILSDGSWGGTTLRTGSRGSAVEQLQFWLNTISQYVSAIPSVTVDGRFGSGTEAAVRAFQRRFGLEADGVVGEATWNAIYAQFFSIQSDNGTPNAYPGTALRQGDEGQNVRLVQFWLKIARTVYTALNNPTVDGRFGPSTQRAVEAFQRYFGLTADGVVGRTTWNKLREVYTDIANDLLAESLRPGEFPGVLRRGSSGRAVRELQYYLYLMHSYDTSIPTVAIDGVYGASTEAAVRAFQRLAGLTVDGVAGRSTWENLYAQANRLRLSGPVITVNRMPYPGAPLSLGSSGDAVLYYTVMLSRIAYYYDTVSSPGILSAYTEGVETGTRSLQQLLGLPVTGAVDDDTWEAAEGLGLALLTGALEPGAAPLPQPEED